MKIVVDFDVCEANALCMEVAPDVFEVREDDYLYLLMDEVPEERRAQMEEAALCCPKAAITIEG